MDASAVDVAPWTGLVSVPAVAAAVVAIVVLALAREPVLALIDTIFGEAARVLDRVGEATRALSADLRRDARETMLHMQREEFANDMASRQKELLSTLERFSALDRKQGDVLKAMETEIDPERGGANARALMSLSAELSASNDRFSRAVEYIERNERVIQAIHEDRVYTFSPFIRFIFSALFIPLILMGGVLNFFLIKRPLDSLFAESGYAFAGFATLSEVAALTIVVIEAVIGFFFLEAMRVTKVLPNFHDLTPRVRAIWAGVFLFILSTLAIIEAALALWRERLIALDAAVEAGGLVELGGAPVVFQVLLGVMMPFVLALVAIPLETCLRNARLVALFLAAFGLSIIALPIFAVSAVSAFLGGVLAAAFTVIVYLPTSVINALPGRSSKGDP